MISLNNRKISFIVACYNPNLKKLLRTVNSIIYQTYKNIEIVISEDGGNTEYFDTLKEYFSLNKFNDYFLNALDKNKGTVRNILEASNHITGYYVKLISPGDYLYDVRTLEEWVSYMDSNDIDISFGQVVPYYLSGDSVNVNDSYRVPINPDAYKYNNLDFYTLFIQYIIIGNRPNGSSFLLKTEIFKRYLLEISDKAKYCEDIIYRHMIIDGLKIFYFDNKSIWYECNTGISNQKNSKWSSILSKDYEFSNKFISSKLTSINLNMKLRFDTIIKLKLKSDVLAQKVKYILFPKAIRLRIMDRKYIANVHDIDLNAYYYWNNNIDNCL